MDSRWFEGRRLAGRRRCRAGGAPAGDGTPTETSFFLFSGEAERWRARAWCGVLPDEETRARGVWARTLVVAWLGGGNGEREKALVANGRWPRAKRRERVSTRLGECRREVVVSETSDRE